MNISFNKETNPDEFEEIQVIGRGGFGCVYELKHKPTGLDLAGKQINDENLGDVNKQALEKENNIMKIIVSDYTVRYYGKIMFKSKLTVLMDFCDRGSLRDIMNYKNKTLTEPQIAFVMHDLLTALNLLHIKKILHRDIKAANILVTSKGIMKLTDFGVSRQFAEDAVTLSTITTIGTPYWMAPEVISIGKKYTFPADIWSVGATAVELAEGGPPYGEYNPNAAMVEIREHGFPGFRKGSNHSTLFQNFVNKCMIVDPNLRPRIPQLLRDPFVTQIEKLDRLKVLEDLIKDPIDFKQLVDDEYDEEEEEEEEVDDDFDDDMLQTIQFDNKTLVANTIEKEDKQPTMLQIEKENHSDTEEENHEPPKDENTELIKEENNEPSEEKLESNESEPKVSFNKDQISSEQVSSGQNEQKKENVKTVVKIQAKKTRTRKYNTKAQNSNATSLKNKKRFETFIQPTQSSVNDIYSKKVAAGPVKIDESLMKKTEEKNAPINSDVSPAQSKSGMNKMKFFGGVVLLLAVLYLALGTKKFVLILILLLPILFLTKNLF